MTAGKWVREHDLQQMWKTAKKQSESKAKKEVAAALAKLQKDKLNENLGKSLGNWPSSYPDVAKLETKKKKIEVKLEKYKKAINGCDGIGEDVKKPMVSAIAVIKRKLDVQFDDAKLAALGADAAAVKKLRSGKGMVGAGPDNKLKK